MATPASPSRRGPARMLLTLSGVAFLLGAILHNPWCLSLAVRAARALFHRAIAVPNASRVIEMQWLFIAAALFFFAVSWIVGRIGVLDRWFRKPLVEKLVLVVMIVVVPIGWLELGLRAFVPPRDQTTTLFMRDDQLGWKLRPDATDRWGGVEVHINERGYRGPAVPYERTVGARRVLYLGDSVTFGYRIERWQDTFPVVIDSIVTARDSLPVETVNLAVEGYSQWQQAIVMAGEAARYKPDLVVLGFVLNDVTEMFHLVRFGGAEEGFQMRHAATSWFDRVLAKSAIVYEVQNVVREVKAKRRLGEDVRLGAIRQEALEVETLMRHPDQPNVKIAWDFALNDVKKIDDECHALGVPLLVVVFPFAVQLSDPAGLSAPQRVITSYAQARGIPVIDLLPVLAAYARDHGLEPSALFLDQDHLSVEGHRIVAEILAEPIGEWMRGRLRGP